MQSASANSLRCPIVRQRTSYTTHAAASIAIEATIASQVEMLATAGSIRFVRGWR